MLDNPYYYNGTIKKIIAVFGSIFNNIYTAKLVDGKMTNISRVPLSYGPKEHTLARLNFNNDALSAETPLVAVKVPRMSFQITSIEYDTSAKLNRLNQTLIPVPGTGSVQRQWQSVPYNIGLQLSIYARNQDDALQVVEQIFPIFSPEYTVAVKDLEGPGTTVNVPITLNNVGLSDEYEGSFETGRRTLIYTLDFTLKIRFVASPSSNIGVIKKVDGVSIYDSTLSENPTSPDSKVKVEVQPGTANKTDPHRVKTTIVCPSIFGFQ